MLIHCKLMINKKSPATSNLTAVSKVAKPGDNELVDSGNTVFF